MLRKMYAVYDKEVNMFDRPFLARNDAEAIRMFAIEIQRAGNVINAHPAHFQLFTLGEYNDNSGQIKSNPTVIMGALEVLALYNHQSGDDQEAA